MVLRRCSTALNRAYRQNGTAFDHPAAIAIARTGVCWGRRSCCPTPSWWFWLRLALEALQAYVPQVESFLLSINVARFTLAGSLLIIGLFVTHWLLPVGQAIVSAIFGRGCWRRLSCGSSQVALLVPIWRAFANYVSTYGSLAGHHDGALIFLYICALVFILGGELNAAISRQRRYWQRQKQQNTTAADVELTNS